MAVVVACLLSFLSQTEDSSSIARERMVKTQIEARGVRDAGVLRAIRATPRHLFVPIALQSQAYEDRALPIGYGATISQPFIVGWMTELLQTSKADRVLEIGTGSGYQAAVLARLAQSVYTMEVVPELARSASRRLAELGYRNVIVRKGDGYQGWVEKAPFERIILTAAPKEIPKALLDQLAPGGRLVAPVGQGFDQTLRVVDKDWEGALHSRPVGPVVFVPMTPR